MENLELLVNKLRQYESETNWFEFKCSNYDPDMIGQDISALANGAAYAEKSSRLIKEACENKLIKKLEETAPRHTKYIPGWA